jgi:hypothetical protein
VRPSNARCASSTPLWNASPWTSLRSIPRSRSAPLLRACVP